MATHDSNQKPFSGIVAIDETRNVHNEMQFVMCMYNHMALKVAMVMRTRKSLKCALILLFTFE